jgi:hypothetical protein
MSDRKDILDNQGRNCDNQSGFDLTTGSDSLTIDRYVEESLGIGGAVINVFKLLGIHEQGALVDLAKQGRAISAGFAGDFLPKSVFDTGCGAWRSSQTGTDVIAQSFIGYDFGPIYNHEDDRNVYGIETNIDKHIKTIVIQQGEEATSRVTKARVERSLDGKIWYGVAIIDLPDNDQMNMIHFDGSSASRYWRLRPLDFKGGANDRWEVQNIQLMDYEKTSLRNLQDEMGFLESRDRDYAEESIEIKASYDLLDTQTDFTMFGSMPSGQNLFFMVSFSQAVRRLGRPIVIGDIFEIPSEAQFSSSLTRIKKYMEVTDVAWSTEGYTPGWQPTLLRVIAEPMLSSQETLDITGDIKKPDATGFLDIDDSNYTDLTDPAHRVITQARENVPERGEDQYDITAFDEEEIQQAAEQGINIAKLGSNQRKLYVEDALPPNGENYTEGEKFPTNPRDREYHRLIYPNTDIPARLFRYSIMKSQWIFCEADRRGQFSKTKPSLQRLLKSDDAVPTSNVTPDGVC